MDKIMNFSEFVNEQNDFERQNDAEKIIKIMFDSIPMRESDVITKYFGLFGEKKLTLLEIAEKFDISEERVKKILDKGIKRLKIRYGNRFKEIAMEILYSNNEEEEEQIRDFIESDGVSIEDFDLQ